jgi:hypothetical protein
MVLRGIAMFSHLIDALRFGVIRREERTTQPTNKVTMFAAGSKGGYSGTKQYKYIMSLLCSAQSERPN